MKRKRLNMRECEAIAKAATREALREYEISPELSAKLRLEVQIEDDRYVFELMSGGRASDAEVGPPPDIAARTAVDRYTGVPSIEVFLPKRP